MTPSHLHSLVPEDTDTVVRPPDPPASSRRLRVIFGLPISSLLALVWSAPAAAQSRLQGASSYMSSPDHNYTLYAIIGGVGVFILGGLIVLGTRKPPKKKKKKSAKRPKKDS